MQAEFIESGALRRVIAGCRAKHRRSAVRAEAPPCGGSQNSPRWLRHENNSCADRSKACELKQRALFLNRANAACGSEPGDNRSGELPHRKTAARATLRIAKPQNDKYQRSNNRKRTTIPNPPAPLRRQRTAESTTSLTRAVTPVTPGRLPLPGTKKGGRPNLPPFSLCGAMITECPARPSTWPPS